MEEAEGTGQVLRCPVPPCRTCVPYPRLGLGAVVTVEPDPVEVSLREYSGAARAPAHTVTTACVGHDCVLPLRDDLSPIGDISYH